MQCDLLGTMTAKPPIQSNGEEPSGGKKPVFPPMTRDEYEGIVEMAQQAKKFARKAAPMDEERILTQEEEKQLADMATANPVPQLSQEEEVKEAEYYAAIGEHYSSEIARLRKEMTSEVQGDEYTSKTGYGAAQLDFLSVFQIDKAPWTRTFSFYDSIAKFLFSSDSKARLKSYQQKSDEFEFQGVTFKSTRTPGQVVRKEKGRDVTFGRWPGEKEELISRALRYLAVQSGIPISFWERPKHSPQIRVAFTRMEICNLLKAWQHTLSPEQVIEGLEVMSRASITITAEGKGKKALYSGSMIAGYWFNKEEKGGKEKIVVILNPLETEAILSGGFRALHFQKLMSLSDPLDRLLYELIMTRFINAPKPPEDEGATLPAYFPVVLSDLIKEGYIEPAKEISKTASRVRKSLERLAQKGVLWANTPFEELRKEAGTGGRKKLLDVEWRIRLSKAAVSDVIAANAEEAVGKDKVLLTLPQEQRRNIRAAAKEKL